MGSGIQSHRDERQRYCDHQSRQACFFGRRIHELCDLQQNPGANFPFYPFIAALDASRNVLESYPLFADAPINTPGGSNQGAFRGIARGTADIAYFEIGYDGIVMHDVTIAATPEAPTFALLGSVVVFVMAACWRRNGFTPVLTRLRENSARNRSLWSRLQVEIREI